MHAPRPRTRKRGDKLKKIHYSGGVAKIALWEGRTVKGACERRRGRLLPRAEERSAVPSEEAIFVQIREEERRHRLYGRLG